MRGREAIPTLAAAALAHGGLLAAGLAMRAGAPPAPALAAAAALATLHGSVRHEAAHGRPFRSARANHALAWAPWDVLWPFLLYRREHLRHHAAGARLTEPGADPESFFVDPARWARLGPARRAALRARSTLAGRMALGPPAEALGIAARAARLDGGARAWAHHAAGLAALGAWLAWCGVPPLLWLLAVAWPASALQHLRSFAEHRPEADPRLRTATVESRGPLAALFLFNNLHEMHHLAPGEPWHRLPGLWRRERARREAAGEPGGEATRGYARLAARFLLRPLAPPAGGP